jgi:hypothetical protein
MVGLVVGAALCHRVVATHSRGDDADNARQQGAHISEYDAGLLAVGGYDEHSAALGAPGSVQEDPSSMIPYPDCGGMGSLISCDGICEHRRDDSTQSSYSSVSSICRD